MASRPGSVGGILSGLFDAALPTGAAMVWASAVIVAGALYCLMYSWLQNAPEPFPVALGWSFCAVLPWFVAFEGAKRGLIAGTSIIRTAPLFVAAAVISLILERFVDRAIFDQATAPLLLQALRRVPAIAAAVTLTVIVLLRLRSPAREMPPGTMPIPVETIDWIKAADNYLELHAGGRVVTFRMTMRQAEAQLAPAGFVRVHRSLLVQAARVARLAGQGGDASVVMADGAILPIGPSYRAVASRLAG